VVEPVGPAGVAGGEGSSVLRLLDDLDAIAVELPYGLQLIADAPDGV
jgi:hypothetical protein